ncbi:MAG: hypothetical protein ACTTIT_05780, partial [Treponema sp.]
MHLLLGTTTQVLRNFAPQNCRQTVNPLNLSKQVHPVRPAAASNDYFSRLFKWRTKSAGSLIS